MPSDNAKKREMSTTLVQEYEVSSWERCEIPRDAELDEVNALLGKNPDDGQLWLRKGHILSEMFMMREAEEAYAMAIACEPFNWEYFRYRGHRFISCWRFRDALADLTIASRIKPDDREVWYHLGLSHFLLGDFPGAERAFAKCLSLTVTDHKIVSVCDWYWMTLKRRGKDAEARKLLDDWIHTNMEAGDHQAYYDRLLLYKGVKKPDELLHFDDPAYSTGDVVTLAYGVANYLDTQGDRKRSNEIIDRLIELGDADRGYFGFAYMAAKVDRTAR